MRVTNSFRRAEKKLWKGKVGQMARHLIKHGLSRSYGRLPPLVVGTLFLIGCLAVVSDDGTDDEEAETKGHT